MNNFEFGSGARADCSSYEWVLRVHFYHFSNIVETLTVDWNTTIGKKIDNGIIMLSF